MRATVAVGERGRAAHLLDEARRVRGRPGSAQNSCQLDVGSSPVWSSTTVCAAGRRVEAGEQDRPVLGDRLGPGSRRSRPGTSAGPRRVVGAASTTQRDEPRAGEDQRRSRRCRRAPGRRPGRAASAAGARGPASPAARGSGLRRHGVHCGGAVGRLGAMRRSFAPRPMVLGAAQPGRRQKETSSVDLFEYQGKQYFARYGIPVSPGGVAETVDEAVDAGRGRRLPGRRQGPGAGRRPRQGRRHQARQRRRRGPHARREHPRHGHQGPHRRAGLGRERLRHRRGVLRQLHARPGRQAAPADAVGAGRRRDRGGRRDRPRRHRQAAHRPGRRAVRGDRPPGRRRRQDPRARRSTASPPSSSSSTTASRRATATSPRSTR